MEIIKKIIKSNYSVVVACGIAFTMASCGPDNRSLDYDAGDIGAVDQTGTGVADQDMGEADMEQQRSEFISQYRERANQLESRIEAMEQRVDDQTVVMTDDSKEQMRNQIGEARAAVDELNHKLDQVESVTDRSWVDMREAVAEQATSAEGILDNIAYHIDHNPDAANNPDAAQQ